MSGYDKSYNLEDSDIMEEEDTTVDDKIKDRKLMVLESQLMTQFRRCHSCGLEVKLETSVVW